MIEDHPDVSPLQQKERTLAEVGKMLGITQSGVRFHEKNALRKLWTLADDPEFIALLIAAQ